MRLKASDLGEGGVARLLSSLLNAISHAAESTAEAQAKVASGGGVHAVVVDVDEVATQVRSLLHFADTSSALGLSLSLSLPTSLLCLHY